MWITKKKWEKELEEIKRSINRNSTKIDIIENGHEVGASIWGSEYNRIGHKETKASTNFIPDVSLEELARYVIDGTPIERDETVKVKYYKGE